MNVILVPGFWLGAWSWQPVTDALSARGHDVTALTPPGLQAPDARPAVRDNDTAETPAPRPTAAPTRIGLADHVAAVVEAIDASTGPVVLVGHSGGGPIIYAALDQRPHRVSRAIYVDSGPLAAGTSINSALVDEAGVIPLPAWSEFDDSELRDLTPELLDLFRRRAVPEPTGVAHDPQRLTDLSETRPGELEFSAVNRYSVPATVITCSMTTQELEDAMEAGYPYVAELSMMTDLTIVDLPTGHWPQFSRPDDLAAAVAEAVELSSAPADDA